MFIYYIRCTNAIKYPLHLPVSLYVRGELVRKSKEDMHHQLSYCMCVFL